MVVKLDNVKLVYDNLQHIKENCNGGILTNGIPSPQSCITSGFKYFGLKCIVTIPYYP